MVQPHTQIDQNAYLQFEQIVANYTVRFLCLKVQIELWPSQNPNKPLSQVADAPTNS